MAHVLTVNGKTPQIHDDVFLAPTAAITGDVVMKRASSAFYGVSVRGDSDQIVVGEGTNLQDNVVLHTDAGAPCVLGDGVSVGHGAVVHGCTVGDRSLIGMSATVMSRAVIGEESLVAAGAVVLEGTQVPPRSLVAGVPAKVRRELTADEVASIRANGERYLRYQQAHRGAVVVPDSLR
ncbi:gamma carbonic anhydrase family protein [Nesterenkonia flava]|uniref:Gamma carbonic anhydrase family protein n=1 Tax=Nesterenkonia flava TaxID=469799 RepID=A0ABU1FVI3_9MICC|nr:gamma carbonic anhydrase family protein [Nesterenkonia flava]MDR5712684.1 gamma carbonic anhydrase family protein [Nesterenkonia flava]